MHNEMTTWGSTGYAVSHEQRQKVLRNRCGRLYLILRCLDES